MGKVRVRFHFNDSKVWDSFSEEYESIRSEVEHEVISDMSKSEFQSWISNIKHKMTSLGSYNGSGEYLELLQDALKKRVDEYNTPTPAESEPVRSEGKKLYVYDGPVTFESKERGKMKLYTHATTWKHALTQLRSKAAKKLNVDSKYVHNVWLDENYLSEVDK